MRAPSDSNEYFDPAGLKLASLIFQWRSFLVINVVIAMILAAGFSLLLPNTYRSEASILPPKDKGSMTPLGTMNLLRGIGAAGFGTSGLSSSGSQQLVTVLRSRSLADIVIVREALVRHYGSDTQPNARRTFRSNLSVVIDADGLVVIKVTDSDPVKAASIVTTALHVLDSINQSLSTVTAGATRRFVETQLAQVEIDLRNAEDALRKFQEERGTIAIEDQLTVIIRNLALLRVERMRHEMELAFLVEQVGPGHKRLAGIHQKIRAIDAQINAAIKSSDSSELLNAGNAPELAMSSIRLFRQVTVYDELYQFLRQTLEQAKIDELRNTPTFTVLDNAIPPDQKWRPLRSFIVLGTGLIVFVILVLLMVWTESTRPARETPRVGYASGWKQLASRSQEPVS